MQQLPDTVQGHMRNVLIKSYLNWRGDTYVPETLKKHGCPTSNDPLVLTDPPKVGKKELAINKSDDKGNDIQIPYEPNVYTQPEKPKINAKHVVPNYRVANRKRKQIDSEGDSKNKPINKKRKIVSGNMFDVGLRWDSQNYSCAYDALFMVLYSLWVDRRSSTLVLPIASYHYADAPTRSLH